MQCEHHIASKQASKHQNQRKGDHITACSQGPSQLRVRRLTVPPVEQVWADLYGLPVPGCEGKTAFQIFEAAGCVAPAPPSCAACLGGPKDTFARMNEAETVVSTTNRCSLAQHLTLDFGLTLHPGL